MSSMGHFRVLSVMRGIAEEAHATEAADPHFVANFRGGRLSGRFGSAHVGGELGEETAHDRSTLGVLPSGTNREHVNNVELQIAISLGLLGIGDAKSTHCRVGLLKEFNMDVIDLHHFVVQAHNG